MTEGTHRQDTTENPIHEFTPLSRRVIKHKLNNEYLSSSKWGQVSLIVEKWL